MTPVDRDSLRALLPQALVGTVESIEAIRAGLSGAGVYAVTASRGKFVLRVQGRQLDAEYFSQQLRVLHRASAAGVAPRIVHVDEDARAVVSVRIAGAPLAAALADSTQRAAVLGSVVDGLRTLHALDPSEVAAREPMPFARTAWEACRYRPGFPSWAAVLAPTFDELAAVLERDPRRVVSHNDVNPGNLLWDGARAWLVDWEVSGLGHAYYDLATLALFLRLDDDTAFALAARHDGAPLDQTSRDTFVALRRLVGLLAGFTFLGLAGDLTVHAAPTLADAPTLIDCYQALRTGLDVQSPKWQAMMGLALTASAFR